MPATHRLRWRIAARQFRGKYSRVAAGSPSRRRIGTKICRYPELPAHGDVFQLELRELVAVEAVGPLAQPGGKGQHGDLHHLIIPRKPIDEAERIGIDEILGIVRHEDLEIDAAAAFVLDHPLVGRIQTIPFGGRTIMRSDGNMDACIVAGYTCDGFSRTRVIRVYADEDIVIAVEQC
jgi:hypothetical protein